MTLQPRFDALASYSNIAIAGLGVTGRAVVDVLKDSGHNLFGVDAHAQIDSPEFAELACESLTITNESLSFDQAKQWLEVNAITLLVASPGWPPHAPLLAASREAGIPIWSEVELAWQLRSQGAPQWLVITGTNGKTTTVRMLAEILKAGGLRTQAVGNIGRPLIYAALDPGLDFLGVELSSFQLHHTYSIQPLASALLNIAPDHLDWHDGFENYVAAKSRVYTNTEVACLYNLADPRTEQLLREADVAQGARAIGVSLGVPALGSLGVVEEHLYDRGFYDARRTSALELGAVSDLSANPNETSVGAHLVLDALFAAGLALAAGTDPASISAGLVNFTQTAAAVAHRGESVGVHNEVTYVNNSKATNPHAARAAFSAQNPGGVVWIVGGQTKGADLSEVVTQVAPYLRGAVVIGAQRAELVEVFARHAPNIPVIDIDDSHTGGVAKTAEFAAAIMDRAVHAASNLAVKGDTVLLAPACASQDQFASFEHRGSAFIAAVEKLKAEEGARR